MTNPTIKDVNVETGEEIEREMTSAEFSQYKLDVANAAQQEAERVAKEAAKAELLAKLGITEDEAKLLLS